MSRRPSAARRACAVLVLLAATSACRNVPFFEQRAFNQRVMAFDVRVLETEMRGHLTTPREGAAGGFSHAGAGGCGCY
jgi:hypothetical protein